MASIVNSLLGRLRLATARGRPGALRRRPGQHILRGASRRAYAFEVHDRDDAADLDGVRAVYVYARRLATDASGAGLELGYVGTTTIGMAAQDAEHARRGHFKGHAFDAVLVLRAEQELVRADIARDLIELHRPVLNDLLRGHEAGGTS